MREHPTHYFATQTRVIREPETSSEEEPGLMNWADVPSESLFKGNFINFKVFSGGSFPGKICGHRVLAEMLHQIRMRKKHERLPDRLGQRRNRMLAEFDPVD